MLEQLAAAAGLTALIMESKFVVLECNKCENCDYFFAGVQPETRISSQMFNVGMSAINAAIEYLRCGGKCRNCEG